MYMCFVNRKSAWHHGEHKEGKYVTKARGVSLCHLKNKNETRNGGPGSPFLASTLNVWVFNRI